MSTSPPREQAETMAIALTTMHEQEAAEILARQLVTERLAACVHVEGPVRSCFRWEQEVQFEEEFRLWIKFPFSRREEVGIRVQALHPYEVPAWTVFRAEEVAPAFLNWAIEATEKSQD